MLYHYHPEKLCNPGNVIKSSLSQVKLFIYESVFMFKLRYICFKYVFFTNHFQKNVQMNLKKHLWAFLDFFQFLLHSLFIFSISNYNLTSDYAKLQEPRVHLIGCPGTVLIGRIGNQMIGESLTNDSINIAFSRLRKS